MSYASQLHDYVDVDRSNDNWQLAIWVLLVSLTTGAVILLFSYFNTQQSLINNQIQTLQLRMQSQDLQNRINQQQVAPVQQAPAQQIIPVPVQTPASAPRAQAPIQSTPDYATQESTNDQPNQ